jgi:hypothetical protein
MFCDVKTILDESFSSCTSHHYAAVLFCLVKIFSFSGLIPNIINVRGRLNNGVGTAHIQANVTTQVSLLSNGE